MPLSATDKEALDRFDQLMDRFAGNTPTGDERYRKIRQATKALALVLAECCPDQRDRALAFTHLEESVYWAHASIARHESD